MKIKRINLKNYNQFKNIELDLTYPKGHTKEGQPLDKVCFIGQSGTGKTSLLRLLKYFVSNSRGIGKNIKLPEIAAGKVSMKMIFDDVEYRKESAETSFYITEISKNGSKVQFEVYKKSLEHFKSKTRPLLINFPTELVFEKNPLDIENTDESTIKSSKEKEEYLDKLALDSIIDFSFEDASKTWDFVLKEIKNHRAEEILWKNRIAEIATGKNTKPKDIEKINREYHQWLTKNPNPLDQLAEKCLNPILLKLGLKVKTDVDLEAILNIGNVLLQTTKGADVHRNFWSTGTKQIVQTATPLFELHPKNAIVLIDEPERSLFPDIQKMVIDFYVGLGKNCQFFFATHSPIIASSFDPWEIVELKFDESNENVIQDKNYTKDRHVDNYQFYPKYLRWDKVLMKVFELNDEGNETYREEELMNAVSLKNELLEMKKQGREKTVLYKKKYGQFVTSATKLSWDEKIG